MTCGKGGSERGKGTDSELKLLCNIPGKYPYDGGRVEAGVDVAIDELPAKLKAVADGERDEPIVKGTVKVTSALALFCTLAPV